MYRALFAAAAIVSALSQGSTIADPPPVDEAALAARLFAMTDPAPGERAVILFDPTYYPGITGRLREALHARGVQTYAIVEDTPAMCLVCSSRPRLRRPELRCGTLASNSCAAGSRR